MATKTLSRPDLSFPGELNGRWKGGRTMRPDGRELVFMPDHPRAGSNRRVLGYILQAEKALGKFLPMTAVVHHLDGNARNNVNSNLVICESQSYHVFLHGRMRAWRACGHASWYRCQSCKEWRAPDLFPEASTWPSRICLPCRPVNETRRRAKMSAYKREWWARRKSANVFLSE